MKYKYETIKQDGRINLCESFWLQRLRYVIFIYILLPFILSSRKVSDDHCERSLAVNIVWNNNNKCLFSALVGASPPPEQHMSKHLNTRESRFTFILKLEEFLSRKTSHASTMSCDQWGRAAAAEWPIRNEHCQWRHLLTRLEIRDLVSWPEPEPGATYTLSHIYIHWVRGYKWWLQAGVTELVFTCEEVTLTSTQCPPSPPVSQHKL